MSLLLFSSQEIYSRFTIELRQVFLAMEVFQAKNISSLFKNNYISRGWAYQDKKRTARQV